MKAWQFPFHSLFLAVYPVIDLYARNSAHIPLAECLRSLGLALGISLLLLVSFRLVLRDWARAGLVCSLLVVLLLSFGHVVNFLGQRVSESPGSLDLGQLRWVWLLALLLLTYAAVRARPSPNATLSLNLAGLLLLALPLPMVLSAILVGRGRTDSQAETLAALRGQETAEAAMPAEPRGDRPDIYYVILDGYARADILEAYYDCDNSTFLEALQDRGFYVVSQSRSNYLSTGYSLNTSLNLIYFHEMPPEVMRAARFDLQTNYVSRFLREQGYEVVVFDSGTGATNHQYADVFLSPGADAIADNPRLNPFELLLLKSTLAPLLFGGSPPDAGGPGGGDVFSAVVNQELSIRRHRIDYALTHLPDIAAREGPSFAFAHIYMPHIPFLYGPNGEPLAYHEDLNLYWYEPPPEDYVELYTYQIDYLNRRLLTTVDEILDSSSRPVVIVLQADHGDDRFFDWNTPSAQGVGSRSAILNAVYFSDGSYERLYPTMTPVNAFRVILNHWFGTAYPLRQDKVFFHGHSVSMPVNVTPQFEDACTELGLCLPPPPY
jgi:hypothetical protein